MNTKIERRGPKLEGCAFANFGNSSGTEEEPSQKREKNGWKKKKKKKKQRERYRDRKKERERDKATDIEG